MEVSADDGKKPTKTVPQRESDHRAMVGMPRDDDRWGLMLWSCGSFIYGSHVLSHVSLHLYHH